MAHQVETMAYANQVPWHGLGTQVDPDISIEEMLIKAGLDWEVEKRPVRIVAEDGTLLEVPTRQGLVRNTDNKVLSIVGTNWHPVQNRELLEFFRSYVGAGGGTLETAGSLRGGKTTWGLANLHDSFTLPGGDKVNGYLLLAGSHEAGTSTQGRVTGVRVVCDNTMQMAFNQSADIAFRQAHTKEFDVEAAKEAIGLAHEEFHQYEQRATVLQSLKLTDRDNIEVLGRHFQPGTDLDELLAANDNWNKQLEGVHWATYNARGAAPGTGWGLMNGVTFFLDHMVGRSQDARVTSAFLGEGARKKMAVEQDLLQMAA